MKFYWIKTHIIIKKIFSSYVWDIPNAEKIVYLTFDDGPTPEITNWVLALLEKYDAKATFFCIGKNISQYPEIVNEILKYNHTIGNHTFDHVLGWKTKDEKYLENVKKCQSEIEKLKTEKVNIFRPPYGKIKLSQSKTLRRLGYKIIMWDVLSADYDEKISPDKCLENVIDNVNPGSIIVFHDSQKAFRNLEHVLPKTLEYLYAKGYSCQSLRF